MTKSKQKTDTKHSLAVIKWIFSQVKAHDRDYLALASLELIFSLATTYLPIIMFTPLLSALAARDLPLALKTLVWFLLAAFICAMLRNLILGRLELGESQIHNKMMRNMKLHLLDIDYPSSQDKNKMESFNQAMNSFRYEIGGLGSSIRRIFTILQSIVSIIFASALTLKMLLSPVGAVNSPKINGGVVFLAEPVWASLITILVIILSLAFQQYGMKKTQTGRRKYLTAHAKVEQDLNYVISEIGGKPKRYPVYQLYDMLPYLREKLTDYAYKGNVFFQKAFHYNAMEGAYFGIVSLVLALLAYSVIVLKVFAGAILMTTVVTYAQSFNQLTAAISDISQKLTMLRVSLPYFDDVIQFMEKENTLATGSIPVEKRHDNEVKFEFHDVSFRYPNSTHWALKNVSFTLDMKRKHAIVGPNGSGKTTLILLLCRLYDPTEGMITLNGIDIKKYDYEEYLTLFATVFQDFALFAFPLGENVACSVDYDQERVINVLNSAGFEATKQAKSLSEELKQPLADFHDSSTRYSGGEQQKIAIARAIYKPSSVVILDEPTAALDPLAEANIYTHLNEMIQDKTTVFISHRMSSCRFCEDILVFDDGQLVQRGTHDGLVDQDGLYRQMWQAQAAYYQ
ncbi:MAG: ABC transporter ATP-binding protein [Eubacteriales bacterium]|nr:ABC transporter ATP-binding protein [Eubacteriales bacterium]